jgi:hypothetical protein
MSTILTASKQWASRPSDQRFVSLIELNQHVQDMRTNSRARVLSSRALSVAPTDDNRDLVAVGPNGSPASLTHWSFGQLAQRAGAPAGYLRDLPAPLAADCINYGMQHVREPESVGILLYKNGGGPELRAVTGPNYGRVWNATITQSLVDRFGDGINGHFRVPGEFGKRVTITKENTTLYASDRDMFVFLADEDRRIEVPNRRDGQTGSLARGFFVWNSETGAQTFGIATFLFDYVCCNRIVWGASDYQEIRIRHTAAAPDKWVEQVVPAVEAYASSSGEGIKRLIHDAQQKRIDDVDTFLQNRFSRTQTAAIKAAHMNDEQRPIESIWDASVAVTAYARGVQYQDDRVTLEREGGKILNLAA